MVDDIATGLSSLNGIIPRSAVRVGSVEVGLVDPFPRLAVLAPKGSPLSQSSKVSSAPTATALSFSVQRTRPT